VLACYRYIELNPVRAGIVAHPDAYAWSSYAANSGFSSDPLISPHPEYLAVAGDPRLRHETYRQLFDETLDESVITAIRDATQGSLPLGSDSFKSGLVASGRKIERGRPGPRPANSESEQDAQLKIVL
jgi:putative transposase